MVVLEMKRLGSGDGDGGKSKTYENVGMPNSRNPPSNVR